MAKPTPISLNTGLDLVNNPLAKQEGALVGCLNYEMTDTSGYKRVDGYERYDGYPNGAIHEYYRITIEAVVPADQVKIVPGVIISRVAGAIKTTIGVVLDGPFPTNKYDVVPVLDPSLFTFEEAFLELEEGVGFLLLQDGEGVISLAEDSNPLGDTFVITGLDGIDFEVTVSGSPIPGRQLAASPEEYINNIREYAALLRAQVLDAPAEIAGLYWFEDRLLAAVNTLQADMNIDTGSLQIPREMARYLWNGIIWRLVDIEVLQIGPGLIQRWRLSLFPIGTHATVNDQLQEIGADGTLGVVITATFSAEEPSTARSTVAALGYFNNPRTSASRGFTYLNPGMRTNFGAGTNQVEAPPPITMADGADPTDSYYVVGGGGSVVLKVRLMDIRQGSTGTWITGNKTGTAQVALIERIAGNRDYVVAGDVLHTEYPTTGLSARFTFNATFMPVIAGTGALDAAGTKYQWITANFYGQSSSLSAYGATGASRGFYANKYAYGAIHGIEDVVVDKPKYVAWFTSHLAYGYKAGSVQLSVLGEPTNFVDGGAAEFATGDDITGLLEMPGDTLAVFGKRSIRRITGFDETTYNVSTIAGSGGCFDYTAVLIGQQAIFTNPNGITSLDQTSAYGDFAGVRLSSAISRWLRRKLVGGISQFGTAGAVVAYPVRSKNQYRLVLNTGEIVVLTLKPDGPALTFMNHSLSQVTRIPYCVSSEVSDTGLERIHVSWTLPLEDRKRAYEIDSGWGYDGVTFNSFVDIAHVFGSGSATYQVAKRLRVFGESYGQATLNLKTAGIEYDFKQPYHKVIQDISLPRNPTLLTTDLEEVTNSVDTAARGLGIKIGLYSTIEEGSTLIEPSHTLQVLMLYSDPEGGLEDG